MADRSDRDEVTDAWRALAGQATGTGWRTIGICAGRPVRYLAGRSAADGEALLVEVGQVPPTLQLPLAKGFHVERAAVDGQGTRWLALTRNNAGNLDLFTAMVEDIIVTVARRSVLAPPLHILLERVRAWQAFMDRGGGLLSPERELGLLGELHVLVASLQAGLPATTACDGWQGPTGAAQDFRWGVGAVEVKASLATGEFPARVPSLEQLDDQTVKPMFVVAVRFALASGGATLPRRVAAARNLLASEPAALAIFDDRLLRAGFVDAHAGHYPRAFAVTEERTFPVGSAFPRLVPSSVPGAVRQARYVLDLDAVQVVPVLFSDALKSLGVI